MITPNTIDMTFDVIVFVVYIIIILYCLTFSTIISRLIYVGIHTLVVEC